MSKTNKTITNKNTKEQNQSEANSVKLTKWQAFKKEWGGFILLLLALFTFRSVIADWNAVPTGSMKPTIYEGDRIWVNKLAYGLRVPFTDIRIKTLGEPKRGEIVVFPEPLSGKRYIKRVIGIEGDVIEVRDNLVYLNGEKLQYSSFTDDELGAVANIPSSERYNDSIDNAFVYLHEKLDDKTYSIRMANPNFYPKIRTADFGPVTVPEGHILFMGDNRDESSDSRYFGHFKPQYTFIPTNTLIGKATRVAWSHDYDNYYIPRKERFFKPIDELPE